jgi:DNA invertase Pin-like site-specific DNA recombinase
MQSHSECVLTSQIADEGFSGYHGDHIKTGQLGFLLKLVRSGKIRRGTRLLVEQPDRLSRQSALEGLDVIRQLVMEGLTIVTLDDGAHISFDSLKADMGQLIMLMVRLSRAHDESKAKSDRAKDVWAAKRSQMKDGDLPVMRVPWWIKDPKRHKELELIFDLAVSGMGSHAISKYLNENGVPSPNGKGTWHTANVSQLLRDKKVIGYFRCNKEQILYKIFPEVISPSAFNKVQEMLLGRHRTIGMKQKWTSVVKGVSFCGACGSTVKPTKTQTGRTMYCRSGRIGACDNTSGLSYRMTVLSVMLIAQHSIASIASEQPVSDDVDKTRASVQVELNEAQNAIDRLTKALAHLDDMDEVISELKVWKEKRLNLSEKLATLTDKDDHDDWLAYLEMYYEELPRLITGHLLDNDVVQEVNLWLVKSGIRAEMDKGYLYITERSGQAWRVNYKTWAEYTVFRKEGEAYTKTGRIVRGVGDGTQYLGADYWYLADAA